MQTSSQTRFAVRFRRTLTLPYEYGAERALQGADLDSWRMLTAACGDIHLRPYLTAPIETIDSLLERGRARNSKREPPHLKGWFGIACDAEYAADLASGLKAWRAVEMVCPEPYLPPPQNTTVLFEDDPASAIQGFQLAAPFGLDVRYAWRHEGARGQSVGVAVVDRAFDLTHPDLGTIPLTFGLSDPGDPADPDLPGFLQHGAAALAVAVSRDNAIGGVGIAPDAPAKGCSAFLGPGSFSTADAIVEAAAFDARVPADPGVIIIELAHVFFADPNNREEKPPVVPAEFFGPIFDAIRAATDAGVVVVEGAGNSNLNLDDVRRDGKAIFNRSSPDFLDSGAIITSACFSGTRGGTARARIFFPGQVIPGTNRLAGLCFGNRVDCFAWGDNVQTGLTGAGSTIGNTSASAPIVGGAVACIQGIATELAGGRLTPDRIRALFSDPSLNTPSADPAVDRIGVMPDLRRILRDGMGLKPISDVVLRDSLQDDGMPRASGGLGASPDIVVRQQMLSDPQAEIGYPWSAPGLPAWLEDPSYIYVRARNLGRFATAPVHADVFWSTLEDVHNPTRWHAIGTVEFPSIPPQTYGVTVSHPLRWDAAAAGRPFIDGEYMLIAFVKDDPGDPMPQALPAFADRAAFAAFVAANNNVATRSHRVYAVGWRRWAYEIVAVFRSIVDRITRPIVRLRPPWK